MANILPQVLAMLGIKVGEEFREKGVPTFTFKVDRQGRVLLKVRDDKWIPTSAYQIRHLLIGEMEIEKVKK